MVVLLTCKNEEYPIKNECTRVQTTRFFQHSRAANSAVHGGISPKFELIQAFMAVLLACKNKADPIKNEGAGVLTTFFY